MKGVLLVIEPTGKKTRYKFNEEPSLQTLQSHVGGYIQLCMVNLEGKWREGFVDEDGIMKARLPNHEFRRMVVDSYPQENVDNCQMFYGTAAIWIPEE